MSLLSRSICARQFHITHVIYAFAVIIIALALNANSMAKELSSEGFSVQIGAFSDPSASTIALAKHINAGEVYSYSQVNLNRYYIGRYETRDAAEKNLQLVRESGFPDAFLAAYSEDFLQQNLPGLNNTINTIALDSGSLLENTSAEYKPHSASFLMKPTKTSSKLDQASVAKIEAALSNLSKSDRDNVVMINGKLWLKDGESIKALPLG